MENIEKNNLDKKNSIIKSLWDKFVKASDDFFRHDVEHCLYWISIVVVIIVALTFGVVIYLNFVYAPDSATECTMKMFFGIPCPGCGGTRAIMALFQGKILTSIYYHALVPYSAAIYGAFFITQTLQRLTKGKVKGIKFHSWYLYGVLVILVVQYIMKLTIPGYNV